MTVEPGVSHQVLLCNFNFTQEAQGNEYDKSGGDSVIMAQRHKTQFTGQG